MMTFRRALFIRFGGLGDILLTTPSLRAVHRAFPGIEIDYIVGKNMSDALTGHPLVRRIVPFDKHGADARPENFAAFLRELSRENYDFVANMHPSVKSYAMRLATGARHSVVFRKRMGVRADTGRITHAVDDFLKEFVSIGVRSVGDTGLDFVVPEHAHANVEAMLRTLGIDSGSRLLVINPAATRLINRWPLDRFGRLAAHFAAMPGVAVAVTGAPSSPASVIDGTGDEALAAKIASHDSRIHNLAGQLTVKEFGALLTRADTLLSSDTGPMQIGAALNTPLVVLSGAADPYRTGPLTPNSTVLIDHTLPCVPCRARHCSRGDIMCMDNLSLENVIAAVAASLEERSRSTRGIALPILS